MDNGKSDLINHLEFQENLSLYIINKLHYRKCFLYDIYAKRAGEALRASEFCENKIFGKYRMSALSMKKSIYNAHLETGT